MNHSDDQTGAGLPLHVLDPGHGDPAHWVRFRHRVLARAAPELVRRREAGHFTVPDLLLSWGRFAVPGSLALAVVSALVLFVAPVEPETGFLGVEEFLAWDDDQPLPPGLLMEEETDLEIFLVAVEGRY